MSKWEERSREFEVSLINQPPTVDCEVDFAVREEVVKPGLRLVVNNDRPAKRVKEPVKC